MYDELRLLAELLFTLFRMFFTYVEALVSVVLPEKEQDVSTDIILVTGAGHGIGKEIAKQYAALGATVICADINEKTNQGTVEDITNSGGKARGYQCDVSSRENILELRDKVKKDVGTVTILVNNAGIMPSLPFPRQTPESIKKQFDINVFAHFWTLEAFLPGMEEAGRGHVVCLSSVAGLAGQPNLVPYCATKFAVRGLMEALSEEHRQRNSPIKFTCIYPYMTDTGLCKNPNVRFDNFFKMLTPEFVASHIISAQRRGIKETSIPSYMLYLNNSIRNMPAKAAKIFIDFVDAKMDPDD